MAYAALALATIVLLGRTAPLAAQGGASCSRAPGVAASFYGAQAYRSTRYFDGNGDARDFGPGQSFTRLQASMYTEWGLPRPFTLITNLSFQRLEFSTPTGSTANTGFGNPEIGLMTDVSKVPGINALFCAFTVNVKLPVVSGGQPLIGFSQTDVEFRARSLGGLHTKWGGWWVTDLSYKRRFGDPADEVRAEGTLGVRVSRNWTVIAQGGITASLKDSVVALGLNPNLAPNYLSATATGSVLYRISRHRRVQVGLQHEFLGRNASNGFSLAVTFWHFFDVF